MTPSRVATTQTCCAAGGGPTTSTAAGGATACPIERAGTRSRVSSTEPAADVPRPGFVAHRAPSESEPRKRNTRLAQVTSADEPRWLDEGEQRSWRALLMGMTLLLDRLDDD